MTLDVKNNDETKNYPSKTNFNVDLNFICCLVYEANICAVHLTSKSGQTFRNSNYGGKKSSLSRVQCTDVPRTRCRSLIFRIEKYSVHFHWLSIKFHLTPSKAWKAGDMLCYHRDTSVKKFIDIHAIRLAIMMHVDGSLNAGGLARPCRHIHHQILWTWKFKSSILWIFHSGKRKFS